MYFPLAEKCHFLVLAKLDGQCGSTAKHRSQADYSENFFENIFEPFGPAIRLLPMSAIIAPQLLVRAANDQIRGPEASPDKSSDSAIANHVVAQQLPDQISRLWRFAMVRCADRAQADDLVQATCVRALERAEQFIPGSRIESWLFSILDSIYRNMRRAQGVRSGNGLIDVAQVGLASGDADEETRLQLVDVIRLVAALPEGQRSVLLLVCIEGLSYEETAQTLAIPLGTVMSRLAAARSRVRRAIE